MDFSNRDAQPQAAAPGARNSASAGGFGGAAARKNGGRNKLELAHIITVVAVAAVAILIAAVIALIVNSGVKPEDKFVDTNRLQAVFLNTGQVYFGHIKSLNDKYFVVNDIYYLQASGGSSANGSGSGSNVTLVKLGCELHEPYDQMVINSDQVTFWENLQDNGQVAKAVKTFQQQNPQGQKCADQSSSASTNSTNKAQNANSSSAPAASSGASNGSTNTTTNTTTNTNSTNP